MDLNGVTGNKPLSRPMAMELLKAVEADPAKRPTVWCNALVMCMRAAGWGPADLINKALKNATKGQVANIMRGDGWPSPREMPYLRKHLPGIANYDDLLPLALRADPKHKEKPAPEAPAPAPITKWIGPPVASFGEGMRWLREKNGLTQPALGMGMGVTATTISRWEQMKPIGDTPFVMIQETYERLCELLPGLEYAPKPPFSQKYQNQFKTDNFIAMREQASAEARERNNINLAIKGHEHAQLAEKAKAAPPPVDTAPANMAGANYGTLKAELHMLQAKKTKLKALYEEKDKAIDAEIEAKQAQVAAAETEMLRAASDVHGVEL